MGLFDDMQKVQMGSLNDMDIESMWYSGGAYFGRERHESGVKWWGSDAKTTSDRARLGVFSTSPLNFNTYIYEIR